MEIRGAEGCGYARPASAGLITTPGIRYCFGQAVGLGVAVAGAADRPSASKNSAYRSRLPRGVRVGGGDAHAPQLRVVLEHPGERVAGAAQLEDVADREPRAVAERLAVHDERVGHDPLDRHVTRPCR